MTPIIYFSFLNIHRKNKFKVYIWLIFLIYLSSALEIERCLDIDKYILFNSILFIRIWSGFQTKSGSVPLEILKPYKLIRYEGPTKIFESEPAENISIFTYLSPVRSWEKLVFTILFV